MCNVLSDYTTPGIYTSAIDLAMMHENCLLVYVHSSVKAENAVLYSILLFLSTFLIYIWAQWVAVELSQALLVWGSFMLAKYEDTESERKADRAQTRGKLMRLQGQRGSMANRERFKDPDGGKRPWLEVWIWDWKKERKWWENVMVGGKQKGLCMKRKTWTVVFDKNRVFRKQNATSWGWQREDWMGDMKYHERSERTKAWGEGGNENLVFYLIS